MDAWRRWLVVGLLGWSTSCGGGSSSEATPDTQAPSFGGVTRATALDDGSARVTWKPAKDDVSPSARIAYRVYAARAGRDIDFGRPVAVSPAGASSLGVSGLSQGVPLEIAVRAVDEAGNEDTNDETVKVTLPDTVAPQFAGVGEVTALSASSLEVRWPAARDSVGVETFLVYFSDDPNPFGAKPRELPADERSTVFKDLDEATTYFAAVRAVDGAGHHDGNRKIASASTLDATPPDFAGIDTLVAGGTAVMARWSPATDNVTAAADIRYRVYAAEDPDELDYDTPTEEVTGNDYVILTGLPPSTSLSVVVRAVDEAGNEDDNDEVATVALGDADDVTPPTFAGAEAATALGARTIRVSWSPATDDLSPPDVLLYDVWYSTVADGQDFLGPPQATSAPGATSVDVTELEPGTTYYFKVRARDLQGLRDTNQIEVSATTVLDDTPPVFRGAGLVRGENATTLRVSWLPATDDTFPQTSIVYEVYVATASGAQNYGTPTVTVTGQTWAEVTGLERETTYYVVVRARDPEGNGEENENEVEGSTLPDTTGPVVATTPTAAATSETSLQVSWVDAVDDSYSAEELIYTVYYSKKSGGPYEKGPTTAAGVTTAELTGLTTDVRYYIVVRPVDPSGNQGSSPETSATPSDDDEPPTFTGTPVLSATTLLSGGELRNRVTVTWTPATDAGTPQEAIAYELCRAVDAACAPFVVHARTAPGATTHTFEGLLVDSPYYFTVRAVDAAGNVAARPAVTAAPPTAPEAPVVANDSARQASVTWTATTSSVFTNLRYSIQYWDACRAPNGWVTEETTSVRTEGATTLVKGYYGPNAARVVAIDGFGNATFGPAGEVYRSGSALASAVLQPLWDQSCNTGAGCHGPAAGIYVSWTTATAKQAPSPGGYPTASVLTTSTDPADSRMYDRILTGNMPPASPLPEDLLCNLGEWILDGAP